MSICLELVLFMEGLIQQVFVCKSQELAYMWLILQLDRCGTNEGGAHVECYVSRNKQQKSIVYHHFLEHIFLLSPAVRTSFVGKKTAVCSIAVGSQCEMHYWSRYE